MKPYMIIGSVVMAFLMAAQPPVEKAEAPHARVCAIASNMTIRPNHLCNRLKVSNDKPIQLIKMLFRPAIINNGTYR